MPSPKLASRYPPKASVASVSPSSSSSSYAGPYRAPGSKLSKFLLADCKPKDSSQVTNTLDFFSTSVCEAFCGIFTSFFIVHSVFMSASIISHFSHSTVQKSYTNFKFADGVFVSVSVYY